MKQKIRFGFCVLLGLLFAVTTPSVGAQKAQTSVQATQNFNSPAPPASPPYPSQQRLQQLEEQVQHSQAELDLYEKWINLFGIIFVVLGVIPALFAMWDGHNSRKESKGVTDLLMQGERDRQKQSNEIHSAFLQSSSDTINLVNQTLTLAKEASERAAKSIERRALSDLDDFDRSAQLLLIRASGTGDDRALVSEPKNRVELETLAERINLIDMYRIVLDEKIQLTARCFFIRGLQEHLKQHFETAIENWQRAANDDKAEPTLRSMAWYWQGYENNNLGNFEDARIAFEQAKNFSTVPRIFELERIAIESEFFDAQKNSTKSALDKIVELIRRAEKEDCPPKILDSLRATAGNILYVRGKELGSSTEEASQCFMHARKFFLAISKPNKWSKLGYAQCCIKLNEDVENARKVLMEGVLPEANQEFVRRVEPRTKALARFTELICCIANPQLADQLPAIRGQLLSAIGEVDNRLTLYSLLQRRNVSKEQFQADVERMITEGVGA